MVLWLRKQFWENCRKKTASFGKIYAPSSELFQKQKKLTEKSNTYRCSYGHSDSNFDDSDETFGRQSEQKFAQIPISSSCFLILKNFFVGLVFGTRYDNLLRFCGEKIRKFTL